MTTIETSIRNLTRSFLTCSHVTGKRPSEEERADTEQAVRLLLALIYAAKNHLRAEWGMNAIPFLLPKSAGDMERRHRRESTSVHQPEYEDLLPSGIRGIRGPRPRPLYPVEHADRELYQTRPRSRMVSSAEREPDDSPIE